MDTELSMLLRGRPAYSAWGETLGSPTRNVFMTLAVSVLAQRRQRPLRILEVGAWVGASAATWSEAMTRFHPPGGQITCVDPWSSYEIQNDFHQGGFLDRYRYALESNLAFRLFSYNAALLPHPVVPMRGRSDQILPLLRDASFDLVYIDGDHAYDSCRFDVEEGKRLVAPGGILCGDDLDMTLSQVDRAFAVANRNKQPAIDPATNYPFHPGVTLAVAEGVPEAANYLGFWAATRGDAGFEPMQNAGGSGFLPSFFDQPVRESVISILRENGFLNAAAEPAAAAAPAATG